MGLSGAPVSHSSTSAWTSDSYAALPVFKPWECLVHWNWWALQDLNLGPTDYESAALTAELRARGEQNTMAVADGQLRIAECGVRIVGTRSAGRGVGRRPVGRIRNPQSPIRN